MTWKQKLPEPPRARYTAREVAASLGVGVKEVMEALVELGEYVDSPAKRVIEEPAKRRVCGHLGVSYLSPVLHTPAPWQWTDRDNRKTELPRRGRPASAGPKDSGTRIVNTPDRSVGLGDLADDVSVTMENFAWTYHGFGMSDRDAWCVYLRPGQAKYAARLRDAGFKPDDLAVEVGGWTVAKRLRAGESMVGVRRLLDRHREAG